jgi:hypothetical protein
MCMYVYIYNILQQIRNSYKVSLHLSVLFQWLVGPSRSEWGTYTRLLVYSLQTRWICWLLDKMSSASAIMFQSKQLVGQQTDTFITCVHKRTCLVFVVDCQQTASFSSGVKVISYCFKTPWLLPLLTNFCMKLRRQVWCLDLPVYG